MTVGFFTDYKRTDECLAAVQLAAVLEEQGHPVQFFPAAKAGHLCPRWDAKVRRNHKGGFADWAQAVTHIVFTEIPPPEALAALKEIGVKTLFLCSWHLLPVDQLKSLESFDRVLCPARAVAELLKEKVPAARTLVLPWATAYPPVRSLHTTSADRLGLVWHLDGSQPLYQPSSFVNLIKKLAGPANIYLTVFYNARMPEESVTLLKELATKLDGRMELLKNASWESQVLVTAAHDLTIWPSLMENFGMPGLLSLAAGTPVVAFDHPVIGEVVKHDVSGVLVPCGLQFDQLGVPTAVFDEKVFLETVQALLGDVERLAGLRSMVQGRHASRRARFDGIAAALFGP